LLLSAATPVGTHVITLQVLDSRSGKPVSADAVEIDCRQGLDRCEGFRIVSDSASASRGQLRIEVPAQATALVISATASQVEQCSAVESGAVYGLRSIEDNGTLAPNDCHPLSERRLRQLSPTPGHLVVFLRHRAVCRRQLPFC
jgi:hypothetical protein